MTGSANPSMIETSRGAVECTVTGHGPAVLALHGAMGGHDQSLLLARAAIGESGIRVIAVSRPGYLGTHLSRGVKPEEQADLCAALLDALGISHAAVIAVSGGGPCALQFALRHPNRCRALVMVSACSAQLTEPLPFRYHLMTWIARVPWLLRLIRKGPAPHLEDPEAGSLFAELQASTLYRMAQRMAGTRNDVARTREPFHYPVDQISAPTLVVHGTADQVVPFVQGESLASRIPGAQLLRLEGGEHVALFTHMHEVRLRVRDFVHAHADLPQSPLHGEPPRLIPERVAIRHGKQ